MSVTRTEAENDIDVAISAAVARMIHDDDVRRSVTQYLITARKSQPVEERTSSVIESILKTLPEEER